MEVDVEVEKENVEEAELCKVDTETGETHKWNMPNFQVSEPVFVERPGATEEDDGVLIASLVNEKEQKEQLPAECHAYHAYGLSTYAHSPTRPSGSHVLPGSVSRPAHTLPPPYPRRGTVRLLLTDGGRIGAEGLPGGLSYGPDLALSIRVLSLRHRPRVLPVCWIWSRTRRRSKKECHKGSHGDAEGVAERAQEEPLPDQGREDHAGDHHQDDSDAGIHLSANARRRLKKENKMTWEPRSKTDEDDDEDDDKDDDKIDDKDDKDDDEKKEDKDVIFSDSEKDKKDIDGGRTSAGTGGPGAGSPGAPPTDVAPKPRIWSLADMATSGGLGGGSTGSLSSLSGGAGKMLGGGMARGLHLEGSPYSRPLFPHTSYPYIPHSVGESLLSYSYTKSLAAGFPPVSLSDVTTAGLLAPAPLVHDLSRHDLSRHDLGRPEITRPEALRPDITRDLPRDLPRHELARPEPHRPEPRPLMDKDV
ncbi:uncharacterized protein LOC122265589 [Penaeus japonicus]|uniref:uncharacterized protein LOC122265589 n=1 Tax=Penaeus japonicus TaxID=27405 RepID=UPI001C70CD73|nr:uncharacterized protein LOC122265589 [Penaeus japonicus]